MASEANYKYELVGVFGHPVAENPTGLMLEAAFEALGLPWRYELFEVYPDDLEDAVRGLRALNMRGINLTIPHKVNVLKHLDEVSPDARLMGAVNTVRRDGDRLIGENTDGKGFLTSLRQDAGVDPAGKNFVVLGAGGAARAMTVELALAGARKITIVNRTAERGRALVELLSQNTKAMVELAAWEEPYAVPGGTQVLVNATSIGLYPNVEEKPGLDYSTITARMVVCDVIPNPPRTAFLKEVESRGAKTLDGLGMLVNQGAIAFRMWTGQDAPVEVMREALKKAFGV